MTKTQLPAWALGLTPDQIAFYENPAMTTARAQCRGSGRHRFNLNELAGRVGSNLPEGIEIIPLADGTCEVRDWCIRGCGRHQSYLTDEQGTILWDTRDYGGDRSYIGTGLDLRRIGADSRYLRHITQEMMAGAIARRIKIARRARLQVAEAS